VGISHHETPPGAIPLPDITITHIDYGDLEGGLVRMMERFKESGTMTGSFEDDDYLRQDPNAALLGLLYDQRVRAEYAFTGPHRLKEKLGHLDMGRIAEMDAEAFCKLFGEQPAVHRFTNKMAATTQEVARIVAERYDGNSANLWNDGADFQTIKKRLRELPGFGEQKAEKMRYVLHYFGYKDYSKES
jgi:uncharacterized HhH-GPD family protein